MKSYKDIITTIIKELGVSANISGFYYIRYAVELIINDAGFIKSMCKGLYPSVAKQFDSTASRIERAIRHAIESGWSRANIDFANEVFGYSVDARKGTPTNSEFLATVADYVIVKYGVTIMKARLKTTFESRGKRVIGHIEDAEMYKDLKTGYKYWEESAYTRITHIEVPKEVFERLLELDRKGGAEG